MKIHNVILIFIGLFFAFFLLFSYQNQTAVHYSQRNTEYAEKLTSACYDAAQTISADFVGKPAGCWDSKAAREETLKIFYKSLAQNLGLDTEVRSRGIQDYTPFVLLVDNPGFYISYNACFDEYGNAIVPDDLDSINVVSELNTYVGTYDNHTVRYYLNDYVDVTLSDGSFYTGERTEVYNNLPHSAKTVLSFLNDSVSFGEMRVEAVVGKVEQVINYYLNTQMINVSNYNTGYQVALPQLTGEDWSRMIAHPTVISFAQGEQEPMDGRMLNVYAYAAGELNKGYLYIILDGEYYCIDKELKNQLQKSVEGPGIVYTYNGERIDALYNSMEECAEAGAVPAGQIF